MKFIRNTILFLLLIVVGLLGYLVLRKDQTHTTEELQAKYETRYSNYYSWRGQDIHYTDQGEGEAILFIHGFGGSFTNWDSAVAIMPEDYRLLTIDLPGFGLSDAFVQHDEERIVDMYVDAVKTLLTDLQIDSATFIGNSMGGYVSWEAAVQHPAMVDRLILVNAAGYDMNEIGGTFINLSRTRFFKWISKKGVPYKLAKIMGRRSVAKRPDEARIKVLHDLLNRKETIATVSLLGQSGETADTTRIPLIDQPTLIIWGEGDHVIEVDHAYRFKRDIPHAELEIYELIAHVPMIEHPERFVEDVVEFIEN